MSLVQSTVLSMIRVRTQPKIYTYTSPYLLANGSKSTSFATLVYRVNDPVDSRVTADLEKKKMRDEYQSI